MLNAIKNLPRTVWLIGLISLVNDSAGEMLYPIIPLYLSSVLMAGPRTLGLIEGVAEATASLLKLFSGVIVDKTQYSKPWIMLGYGLAGFGRPLIAFINSWPWLMLIRFTDRVGKGLRSSPRDALLADSVDAAQRGLAFGLHRAMDNAGSVLGPLLAFALLSAAVPLKTIFLWAFVPALLCLCLTFAINEPRKPAHHNPTKFNWCLANLPTVFKRYLLVVALFTLGNSSNMFLLLRAQELGVAAEHIPLLWAAVSAVAMIFSTPLSALSDRIGRTQLLFWGYIAYAVFYLGLGLIVDNGWMLAGLFGFYGLFMAATEGVEKALVADLAPANLRGTAFGWFNLVAGAFLLPASVIFGSLYQSASSLMAFGFSAACALLSAVLLRVWVRA
jgi:MFS family permease